MEFLLEISLWNTCLCIFVISSTKKDKLFITSNCKETNVADIRETVTPQESVAQRPPLYKRLTNKSEVQSKFFLEVKRNNRWFYESMRMLSLIAYGFINKICTHPLALLKRFKDSPTRGTGNMVGRALSLVSLKCLPLSQSGMLYFKTKALPAICSKLG